MTTGELVFLRHVVAHGEIKDESISGKIKSLFGAGSSASATETESDGEPSARSDDAETASAASAAPNASETEKVEKKVEVKDTIKLQVETTFPALPPLSVQARRTSRDRCVYCEYAFVAPD